MSRLERSTSNVSNFLAGSALSADVSSEYAEMAGDETVGRRARYADLTVVGPELLADETLRNKVIEGALFFSGKPLLLVPEGSMPTLKPKRIMVAWDSRIEASRAVRESLEMLAAADDVRLVLVDPVEANDHHGAEPGADAAAYLARHGVKVTVDRLPSSNHSVAEVLHRHAIDTSSELLVMGAYGHSRLRERSSAGSPSPCWRTASAYPDGAVTIPDANNLRSISYAQPPPACHNARCQLRTNSEARSPCRRGRRCRR